MENKMLISVAQEGELRVAILRGKALHDLDIEYSGIEQKKANIYRARVSKVEQSLEAAFVDYGADKHGFLPLKEISKLYFTPGFTGEFSNLNIKDVLKEGQELIVQIDKEERGTKGAALTTFISLAGSYVVLMPNNPRAGGISRRIDGQERDELREIIRKLQIPEDMGVIVRTAGIGKSTEELQRDLDMLLQHWSSILKASEERPAPFLIYQESDGAIRAVRDHLRQEISEIIVDHIPTYEKVKKYISLVKPDFADRIKFYDSKVPLFSFYQIEKQIESAYQRVVRLPSGGSIVLDHTEALVSIDVNSARATGGSDIEETALNTNLEAASEIARQLRIRDIGGLIVIDFIDMSSTRNQREVSQKMRDVLRYDRARVQVGNISRFGLLEMSRQRLRSHISEAVQVTCPRCDGQGTIRSIESLANSIVHLICEEATKETVGQIQVQVPLDLATFLLNEKRLMLNEIEKINNACVIILPNQHLETPKYKIKTIRKSESGGKGDRGSVSYKYIETTDSAMPEKQIHVEKPQEEPAVSPTSIVPQLSESFYKSPAIAKPEKSPSVLKNIISAIFGANKPKAEDKTIAKNDEETANKNIKKYPHKPRYNNRVKKNRFGLVNQGYKKPTKDLIAETTTTATPATPATTEELEANKSPRQQTRRGIRGGNKRRSPHHNDSGSLRRSHAHLPMPVTPEAVTIHEHARPAAPTQTAPNHENIRRECAPTNVAEPKTEHTQSHPSVAKPVQAPTTPPPQPSQPPSAVPQQHTTPNQTTSSVAPANAQHTHVEPVAAPPEKKTGSLLVRSSSINGDNSKE